MIEQLLLQVITKYPTLLAVAAAIGTSRIFMVPLMQVVRLVVKATPSKEDDKILDSIDKSQLKKAFIFTVDYLASLNLTDIVGGK